VPFYDLLPVGRSLLRRRHRNEKKDDFAGPRLGGALRRPASQRRSDDFGSF